MVVRRGSPQPRRPQRPLRAKGSRRSGIAGFWLFLLGALLGAGVLYLACFDASTGPGRAAGPAEREEPREASRETARETAGEKSREAGRDAAAETARKPAPPSDSVAPASHSIEPSAPADGSPPPGRAGRVALVIDDLGRSTDDLVPLEKLGVPITYAVLPFEENTQAVVSHLRNHRQEVILHLPMEPKHGQDPGPGALRVGMTDGELRMLTLSALQAVPGAVGVNNHMGSSLSADARSMGTILRVLASRGLFFLDSRTSSDSVGYRTAVALGVPAAERQIFLDSDPGQEAVHEQFLRLLDTARTRGAAVAIGHPHPDTLAALAEEVPRARALGYDFVPVSFLLDRSSGQQE